MTELLVRAGCIAALALWTHRVGAQAVARVGLYEWATGVGWTTFASSIVLALLCGLASSARRMADPNRNVPARLLQVAADMLSAVVGGVLAVLIGEMFLLSPPATAIITMALGWGGAILLDEQFRRLLAKIIPGGGDGS